MKIELRNIKYSAFASEETHCYEAALYVDGKKIGTVSNSGHGGADMFHGDRTAFAAAEAWVQANMPKEEYDAGNGEVMTLDPSMEILCANLVNDFLLDKRIKRLLSKEVMFLRPSDNALLGVKLRKGEAVADLAKRISDKYPGAAILNTMSQDEVRKIVRKQA